MEPDKFQQAWRAQGAQTRVTIHTDLLLQEVQRRRKNFRTVIFWRDFREVGVSLLMIPVWILMGISMKSPWTWYLTIPGLLWIAAFMLIYRALYKQKPSEGGAPLVECVKKSLAEVEDQVWLLRNVWWWYLLPLLVSNLVFCGQVLWNMAATAESWWGAVALGLFLFFVGLFFFAFFIAIYGYIYFINQRAVEVQLEPMRQDLLMLLASLRDETEVEIKDGQVELPAMPFTKGGLVTAGLSPGRISIDSLLEEVQCHRRNFLAMIFWRDFREVVMSLLLVPTWIFMGISMKLPWAWYLGIPAFLWVAVFVLVYRARHPQKPSEADEPLVESVKKSLGEVEDQIWLLRHVGWWYLLPLLIANLAFCGQILWGMAVIAAGLKETMELVMFWAILALEGLFLFAFFIGIYVFIYRVNQRAVKMQLEPMRRDLLMLLGKLGDERDGAVKDDQIELPGLLLAKGILAVPDPSPGAIAVMVIVLVLVMLFVGAVVMGVVSLISLLKG